MVRTSALRLAAFIAWRRATGCTLPVSVRGRLSTKAHGADTQPAQALLHQARSSRTSSHPGEPGGRRHPTMSSPHPQPTPTLSPTAASTRSPATRSPARTRARTACMRRPGRNAFDRSEARLTGAVGGAPGLRNSPAGGQVSAGVPACRPAIAENMVSEDSKPSAAVSATGCASAPPRPPGRRCLTHTLRRRPRDEARRQ